MRRLSTLIRYIDGLNRFLLPLIRNKDPPAKYFLLLDVNVHTAEFWLEALYNNETVLDYYSLGKLIISI